MARFVRREQPLAKLAIINCWSSFPLHASAYQQVFERARGRREYPFAVSNHRDNPMGRAARESAEYGAWRAIITHMAGKRRQQGDTQSRADQSAHGCEPFGLKSDAGRKASITACFARDDAQFAKTRPEKNERLLS